ncbi:MAG: hypothetical protein HZA61_08620 [Candidatus Eisenbacteria bacterium]|uniref:Uncharacterized protein n=1 Tax=Eiseniibacteriota bacterium TaxID=2212470 RepID=A0A933SDU2_UNCEI|nr:hypothetical protein [Candidatus Eisenbacteria bacterium]
MKLEQAYYTSCTMGLRSGMGFQFNAASSGLTPQTLLLLERIGLYVPPLSAPSRPTESELRQFPVGLVFQPLPDGSAVLACARYVGQDYSGRFGNYFTHSLWTPQPASDFRDLLPIELWDSPVWCAQAVESTSLPALENLPAGGAIDPARVTEFLAHGDRAAHLPAMITAAEAALASRKRMILVDDAASIALWVAAVTYALPRPLALALSFTTYTRAPYQSEALLTGTTPDAEFRFAPHEIEHQFSVFDFVGRRFSPCRAPSRFARTVTDAYAAGHAEVVAGFADFLLQAAPEVSGEELAVAFEAYLVSRGLLDGGGDTAGVAGWCAAHMTTLAPELLQRVFASIVDGRASQPGTVEAAARIVRASFAQPPTASRHAPTQRHWVEWLVREAAVAATPSELLAALHGRSPASVLALARPSRSAWLQQAKPGLDAARAEVYWCVGEHLGYFDEPSEQLRRAGEHFAGPALGSARVREGMAAVLSTAAGRDVLEGLADHLVTRVSEPGVFAALGPVLSRSDVASRLEEYALGRRAVGLYLQLVALRAKSAPGTRLAALQDCLAAFRRHGIAASGADLDNAFQAVWTEGPPSPEEALRLLDGPTGKDIAGTSIPARLAESLGTISDLLQPGPEAHRLLAALRVRPEAMSDPAVATILEAFEIASASLRPDADPASIVRQSLACALRVPPGLATPLRNLAAANLVSVADHVAHGRALEEACSTGDERFAMAYVQALRGKLDAAPLDRPARFARAYRAWEALARRADEPVARYLAGRGLAYVVERWSRRELGDVARALEDSPTSRARWEAWLAQRGRGGGAPAGGGGARAGSGHAAGGGGFLEAILRMFGLGGNRG